MKLLVGIAVATGVALFGVAPLAAADVTPGGSYDGTAVAYGNLVTATNPSVPLGLSLEQSAPESRVRLTSLGESSALAAGPYLGDSATGIAFSQAGGKGLGGLDFPLVAVTSAGDKPKDVTAPGVDLHAESGVNLAAARAALGTGANRAATDARVERVTGGTSASASSLIDTVVLFDKLLISGLRSSAETVADDSGNRTRRGTLSIGRLTARGITITVPPESPLGAGAQITGPDLGFVDGQFFLEVPGAPKNSVPVDAAAVADAFRAVGLTMTFAKAVETDTGIISPSLTISGVLPAPPENPQVNGETPVSVTLGRTAASVTVRPAAAIPALAPATGTTPAATTPDTTPAVDNAALPGLIPDAASGATVPTVDLGTAPAAGDRAALTSASYAHPDLAPVYLALGLAAAVAMGAAGIVRSMSVSRGKGV
ncbi:hypothetical protein GCM10009547_07970 [Sporichthya brevicatena]|uniref:Choice-of-anchor G family protein n=1 Tax=Sporichthya brevicatena TaxID=171442 RepID=A0ABP3RJ50_9ACTN